MILIRIVRLLLEDEDSVQAETYQSRAALLINSTDDQATVLQYKLCQARIMDYNRKFLEAASRYLELSWAGDIDEEERKQMLYAPPSPHLDVELRLINVQLLCRYVRCLGSRRSQSFPCSCLHLP